MPTRSSMNWVGQHQHAPPSTEARPANGFGRRGTSVVCCVSPQPTPCVGVGKHTAPIDLPPPGLPVHSATSRSCLPSAGLQPAISPEALVPLDAGSSTHWQPSPAVPSAQECLCTAPSVSRVKHACWVFCCLRLCSAWQGPSHLHRLREQEGTAFPPLLRSSCWWFAPPPWTPCSSPGLVGGLQPVPNVALDVPACRLLACPAWQARPVDSPRRGAVCGQHGRPYVPGRPPAAPST